MTILRRLTEGIRDFVSPLRRRQQRERRLQDFAVPFAPQTPPNHQPRPRHGKTVSPTSRIAKWQEDAGTATAWADDTDDERRQDADLASQWNSNLNANGDVQVARPEDIDPDAGLIQNVSAQERQCMAKAAQLRQSGWEEHPIWLHYKISMRGFEPILPHHWLMDLETIPLSLFAEKVEDAFIRTDYGSDFRGIVLPPLVATP